MATNIKSIVSCVETLIDAAPAGFALAFHINFTTPRLMFQTYAADWVRYYSEKGLVMSDPTVLWGFENDGTKRWSDLAEMDTAGVLDAAKDHGMSFGLTCAVSLEGTKTIGSFSRDDAEYDDGEVLELKAKLEELHLETAKITSLNAETKQALEDISVQVLAS